MNTTGKIAHIAGMLLAAAAAACTVPTAGQQPFAWPAAPWGEGQPRNVAEFNANMSANEAWARDPLWVAKELMDHWGPDSDDPNSDNPGLWLPDQRSRIDIEFNSPQGPDAVHVTVQRAGFLDDAIRGDATRITLERRADGTWRPVAAEQLNWCWRGEVTDRFITGLCP